MTALASDPIRQVLAHLPDAKKSGKGWKAKCPAHEDRHASLSISAGDNGAVLIRCHAGCSIENICDRMGLPVKDLFPPRAGHNGNGSARRIVAEYSYVNAAGDLIYQTVRYSPKDFRQRRPDGKSGWIWNLDSVERVLYRLIELRESDPDEWVFIVEGEKDADRLASVGLIATCNVGGAGKWKLEYNEALRDRRVCIIADKDGPGRKHAQQVAASLRGIAREMRIIELPGDGVKDASDFLGAGGTAETLANMAEAAPVWTPETVPPDESQLPASDPVIVNMADVESRRIRWIWPKRIPQGRLSMFVGMPGAGKSFALMDISARITRGIAWPDGEPCEAGDVLLISGEDDPHDQIRPRLDACGADVSRVHLLSMVRRIGEDGKPFEVLFSLADVLALEIALKKIPNCKLVVVDPIGSFIGGQIDSYRDNEVRSILTPLAKLAERFNVGVLLIAHRRKAASNHADQTALGSVSFIGICRVVYHLSRDRDNRERRLLLPGKCNLCSEPMGLAFTVEGDPARIVWEAEGVEMTADEAMAAEENRPASQSREDVQAWLRNELADLGEHSVESIREAAGQAGFNWRRVQRAREDIGALVHRASFGGAYIWRLPKPGLGDSTHGTKKHGTHGTQGKTGVIQGKVENTHE